MKIYLNKIIIILFLAISPIVFLGIIKNTAEAVENDNTKYITMWYKNHGFILLSHCNAFFPVLYYYHIVTKKSRLYITIID